MITLHGFAASNYYNVVKHVLLHKDIPFQEDLIYNGTDDLLPVSPVGKVPAITTAAGRHLSETTVICDYIEAVYPEPPLYPEDAGERAERRLDPVIVPERHDPPCATGGPGQLLRLLPPAFHRRRQLLL